jgi:hypothetical protein
MKIHVDLTVGRRTKWYEYALRFLFGGLITAIAGIIAKEFGPEIGGLFLAFPAIFPASATLIEKHESEKKAQLGLKGTKRAAQAVSLAAAGASIGTIGLAAFALVIWKIIPDHSPWFVLIAATLVWMTLSVLLWQVRKRFALFRRRI